jgi:hypothetical protein
MILNATKAPGRYRHARTDIAKLIARIYKAYANDTDSSGSVEDGFPFFMSRAVSTTGGTT